MHKPLIVETVTAPTTAELRRGRDGAADADLVEVRIDSVKDPSVAGALDGRRRPVIVTCRPAWEGGQFAGSEEERLRLLTEAYARGAEYVDVEWAAGFDDLIKGGGGRRIVLSSHDFSGVPSDLDARVRAMRSTGAELIKVAVKTRRLSDCVGLFEVGSRRGREGGLVLIGMGEHGLATRVLAARFGSAWAYAGAQATVGQVSVASLLGDYRFRMVTESTGVYGLVGRPVSHSVSPAMHNAAFGAAQVDAVYLPLPAVDANDFVAFARAVGVQGASVTTPYKVALHDRLDEASVEARRIGAVNTIRIVEGRWLGRNTDVNGFLEPLRDRVALAGLRAAVLGAGGAGRAVAIALASSGAAISVHAREAARAQQVAKLAGGRVGAWPPEPGSWDLLVNCTPIGMYPRVAASPVPAGRLTGRYVYDLVYNPPVTQLLRDASEAGCQTIGGLEMLVAQAHEQFQWWTGSRPPSGVMRDAALKRLAEFVRDEDYVV